MERDLHDAEQLLKALLLALENIDDAMPVSTITSNST
jgi:hypothetical protein